MCTDCINMNAAFVCDKGQKVIPGSVFLWPTGHILATNSKSNDFNINDQDFICNYSCLLE